MKAVELCQRVYYLMSHPFPILSASYTIGRPGRRTKLRQEGVIDIMHLQRGNCCLTCVLALFVKPSSKEKWKCVSELNKKKKDQTLFEFMLQGLLFSDRLNDRRQCFHGAVPVGNQRREEFAAECNKGLVRLGTSCAGSLKNTERKQGSAPETGKEQKEERVALIPEHVGTKSAAQGLVVQQFIQHLFWLLPKKGCCVLGTFSPTVLTFRITQKV